MNNEQTMEHQIMKNQIPYEEDDQSLNERTNIIERFSIQEDIDNYPQDESSHIQYQDMTALSFLTLESKPNDSDIETSRKRQKIEQLKAQTEKEGMKEPLIKFYEAFNFSQEELLK